MLIRAGYLRIRVWLFSCLLLVLPAGMHAAGPASSWPAYGGDAGGQRYSALKQVTARNVTTLKRAWEYHTDALARPRSGAPSASFETTPILFQGLLYLTTPFDQIIALDSATGRRQWTYDPAVNAMTGSLVTSRGVAAWDSGEMQTTPCSRRIFIGTLDARLIAVNANDGKPCLGFGDHGTVDLLKNLQHVPGTSLAVTSAPTILGNVVVVGSSIADNQAVAMERGSVRGYDVLSGRLLWTWDPIPWADKQKLRTGAANAWSTISADPQLGLIFIPTGSPSPDYFGGMRPGNNADADSVVALEAQTGKKVWAFQLVHHDLWDYDTAAQPLLFTFHGTIPAIAVTNKTGMVYVLDRRTGVPLYPVEEKSVPQSDVPEEMSSPTQPISSLPAMNPVSLLDGGPDAWQRPPQDAQVCQQKFATLRSDGLFTPPSLRGTAEFPGKLGGVNWGSAAYDPETGIYYANNNRTAYEVKLIPRQPVSMFVQLLRIIFYVVSSHPVLELFGAVLMLAIGFVWGLTSRPGFSLVVLGAGAMLAILLQVVHVRRTQKILFDKATHTGLGIDDSPMLGTPYSLFLRPIFDPAGRPCTHQPWSALTALNLQTGKRLWMVPLGTTVAGQHTGDIELGGPLVTAGGLLFTAGTREPTFRAFDKLSGKELWSAALPAPALATPMTYSANGRQFVVVAAGGHGMLNTAQGDSLVAFGLPE